MADILIYRMKMPEKEPLRLVLNPNGQLFVDHGVTFTEYEAVELPAHGDLIDRNVARDKIAEQETSYYMDMDGVDDGLLETPVIIPASKEESDE